MNTVEGVVEVIRVARGVSVKMQDGTWYGAGFDAAKVSFKEGNKIRFVFTEKGIYKNIDLNTVEVVDASENTNMKPKADSGEQKTSAGKTVTRDSYWSGKEEEDKFKSKEIRYEACLHRAIAMVDLLITSGAVSLGSNTKKKAEIVDKAVEAYTATFFTNAGKAREGYYDVASGEEQDIPEQEVSYE